MRVAASTQPSATIALKPSIATPIASTHMRMRVQSPMLTMSATAPMVQKCVRWAIAPNSTASAKAPHSTASQRIEVEFLHERIVAAAPAPASVGMAWQGSVPLTRCEGLP